MSGFTDGLKVGLPFFHVFEDDDDDSFNSLMWIELSKNLFHALSFVLTERFV